MTRKGITLFNAGSKPQSGIYECTHCTEVQNLIKPTSKLAPCFICKSGQFRIKYLWLSTSK